MKKIQRLFPFFLIFNEILCEQIKPEERPILKQFREIMQEMPKNSTDSGLLNYTLNYLNEYSDAFLVNWLRHSEYNLEKSEKALRKSLEWRKNNNLQNFEKWKTPAYLKEMFPYYFTGYTTDTEDQGTLVFYVPFGSWNAIQVITRNQRDFTKYLIQMNELIQSGLKVQNKKRKLENQHAEDKGQAHLIADMDKFSLIQVTSIRVLGFLASFLGLYDSNYPLSHDQVFVINAPRYFSVILDVLKSVLSPISFRNINVYSHDSNEWLPIVLKYISLDLIPEKLGGRAQLQHNYTFK